MCRFPHLLFFTLWLGAAHAQLTGHVDVPALGFAFDIPTGWNGLEQQGSWGLVNDSVPGTIIISTHQYHDLKTLEQDMTAVPEEDPANSLHQVGPVRHPLPNGIELDFQGTMEWQPVWIGAIGLISGAGGPGLSIVALGQGTEPVLPLLEAAMSVIESVHFSPPVIPPIVEQWRAHLTATRLTSIASYTSTPRQDGGLGGGMSSTRTLDLCPGGWYALSYGTDLTLGGADASAAGSSAGTETGSWDVFTDGMKGARLELRSNDGSIRSYPLEDRDGATYLDGERWFRTTATDGANAPHCDP